jgi:anti-anti-sigma factor
MRAPHQIIILTEKQESIQELVMALCEVRTKGEITIVVMPLQIDYVAALELDHELHELAAREPKALLCDFSGTKYISSSGLRIILKTAKTVKTEGGRFGIFALAPFVDHIFTMSGFAQILSIYDNEEAAIRAVSH